MLIHLYLLMVAGAETTPLDSSVARILSTHCVICHRQEKAKGGLRLDTAAGLAKGGNSGPVVVPAKPELSRIIVAVSGKDTELAMPPKPRTPLAKEEIRALVAWVEGGARWSDEVRLRPAISVADEAKPHWAFQPIKKPVVPDVSGAATPIDAFLLERLRKEGLEPSKAADKATLLRRVWLDMTGLPPSLDEINAFMSDNRPEAFERMVDRALSSPHFGERWARHWLDLARYADSDGYEKDTARPNAFRYRDWVIEAFNSNMPFNQFAIEQLAGDLLPGATSSQKQATGFHRNTLTNKEGGVDQEQFRVEAVVDRVNTTARVFLGLTMGCAQCHDHKYDPLSQREYYELFAFFNSDVEADIPVTGVPEYEAWEKAREAHSTKVSELEQKLKSLKQAKDSKGAAAAEKDLAALKRAAPKPPVMPTMAKGADRQTRVMIRGDFLRPGATVAAGTPAVLPPLRHESQQPNRLELARWLTGSENPLTARVLANWFWSKLFGRGLVATLEDFGTQGEPPSHPELLDWLADRFRSAGWDTKAFLRTVVMSHAYRQSSAWRQDLAEKDPYNRLLGRQARLRLEAETVRDVCLAASGLLAPRIGGPSVRPPQPAGISELTYANSAKWVESKGDDRYRRGLYTWFQRTSPYPMLMTFDAPDANLCVMRRERSTTPLQALTLLNDPVFFECAQSLGGRLRAVSGDDGARLAEGMLRVAGRPPRPGENMALAEFLAEARRKASASADPDAAAWTLVARVLLNLESVPVRE